MATNADPRQRPSPATNSSEETRPGFGLSARELEVLMLMADGLNNPEIAWDLHVSLGTANKHVSSVIAKMRARSRTDAVSKAFRAGLVR